MALAVSTAGPDSTPKPNVAAFTESYGTCSEAVQGTDVVSSLNAGASAGIGTAAGVLTPPAIFVM